MRELEHGPCRKGRYRRARAAIVSSAFYKDYLLFVQPVQLLLIHGRHQDQGTPHTSPLAASYLAATYFDTRFQTLAASTSLSRNLVIQDKYRFRRRTTAKNDHFRKRPSRRTITRAAIIRTPVFRATVPRSNALKSERLNNERLADKIAVSQNERTEKHRLKYDCLAERASRGKDVSRLTV